MHGGLLAGVAAQIGADVVADYLGRVVLVGAFVVVDAVVGAGANTAAEPVIDGNTVTVTWTTDLGDGTTGILDATTGVVEIQVRLPEDVSYDAVGCSISQASASVLYDLVVGKSVDEAMAIHQEFLTLMQGKGTVEPDEDVLEDGIAFAGVAKFPARVKCALLSWMAWKDATAQVVAGEGDKA